jgi:hypothetical protein
LTRSGCNLTPSTPFLKIKQIFLKIAAEMLFIENVLRDNNHFSVRFKASLMRQDPDPVNIS